MFNMSAAMAKEFATRATEMTERIAQIGPSPLRTASHDTSAARNSQDRSMESEP